MKLAIDGGKPVRTELWPEWPVFKSRAGATQTFQEEFCEFLGSPYAIALANGSVALELALEVLGIGEGDEVIVPSRTFIASASCCVMRGAIPVFADIDGISQNINVDTIQDLITGRTRAIICVHLAGWPCEMDEILMLAKEKGLFVIEDCAQALGAKYRGKMVGTIGDIGTFSFCEDKIMTTGGEGGMLVTGNRGWYKKAWSYKDHGKNFGRYMEGKNKGSYYTSLGTNWRMTDGQAMIGSMMLEKVPGWLRKRRDFADTLDIGLQSVAGIRLTIPPSHIEHAYYKYYVFVRPEMLKKTWSRDRIIEAITAEGVPCGFGSTWAIGMETCWAIAKLAGQKIHRNIRMHVSQPVDHQLGTTALCFLVHPTMSHLEIIDTIQAITKVMKEAVQ